MNKFIAKGNLTRDPELSTAGGAKLCKFGLAVQRSYPTKTKEGEVNTDFFNVVCWRAIAENCAKYLKKGKPVIVSGSIQISQYTSNDGTKRQSVDIVADEVEFLGTKGDTTDSPQYYGSDTPKDDHKVVDQLKNVTVESDDLPF
ncbi:MAG: single-stranded DNA-binding protein [Christensenellaceae bacterium]|jgi:single-strand DNA-binding protein|nr:single-stranded DNA-binding protein [Christensenellaceae bacterium]